MVFPNLPTTECWQEDNRDSSSVPSLFAVKEWVENLPPSNRSEVVNRRRSDGGRPSAKVPVSVNKRQSLGPLQRPSVVTATDIYYQAIAKRRARAKLSVVSMIGFGESTINPPPWEANNNTVKPDRASMLRAAFSQRLDKSDGTGFSFDSYDRDATVVDVFDEPEEFTDAEELLFELGFGGPNYGFERIPDRFLTPSLARGIDVTSFLHAFSSEHRETTVLPPSRRTSGIFTASQPSENSSFEQLQLREQQPIVHHHEEEEEEQQSTVVMDHHLEEIAEINELSPLSSEPQSTTSSRKSSLHRQDCFEDQQSLSDEVQNEEFVLETVIPQEPVQKDVEAVVNILQLAVEAYRVQIESIDHCSDLNEIKDQLQQELSRTDQLLNGLQDRVASSDPTSLRTILDDMMVLLRHQQLLHRQVIDMRQLIPDSPCPSPVPSSQSSSSSTAIQVDSRWIQSFERRLTAQIRRTVRRELTRAFKRPLLVSKTKKRTS